MAGVPEPVVGRSREVLARLREEKAIEAKGGNSDPVQAVFDLSAGQFRRGQDGVEEPTGDGQAVRERFGDDADAVLEGLAGIDVDETPPVELMATVQELQERLDGE
jgi:DNA mismatch repair protein MutS